MNFSYSMPMSFYNRLCNFATISIKFCELNDVSMSNQPYYDDDLKIEVPFINFDCEGLR
jgi:hypothetical protein